MSRTSLTDQLVDLRRVYTGENLSQAVPAVKAALRRWMRPAGPLVVVSGSLPELIRTALAALDQLGTTTATAGPAVSCPSWGSR